MYLLFVPKGVFAEDGLVNKSSETDVEYESVLWLDVPEEGGVGLEGIVGEGHLHLAIE